MAYRAAGKPVVLGFGVAVMLGTSVGVPAIALADEPSASPSVTSSGDTTTEPTPEPSTPDPDPSTPTPDPTTPDPDPSTPTPDPTTPDPEPSTPGPKPTTPGPKPSSPSPSPSPTKPGEPDDPDKPGGKPTDPTDPGEPPAGSKVAIKLSLSGTTASPGGTLTATAHVRAGTGRTAKDARLTLSGSGFTVKQCTIYDPCALGYVNSGGESVAVTVYVPSSAQPGGYITVYATVTAAQSDPQTASVAFGVADGSPGANTVLPPDLPPGQDPLSGAALPQVVLPPVASPQIAPGTILISPVAAIRDNDGDGEPTGWTATRQGVAAVQAGWLSALLATISLLLASLRLAPRRTSAPRPGAGRSLRLDRDLRRRLGGKKPTAARVRTLPPVPAPAPRPRPRIRIAWLPPRPTGLPVHRDRPAGA